MLEDRLAYLVSKGCYPCLVFRGYDPEKKPIWRAHINGAGNFWNEGNSPLDALSKAISLWLQNGSPLDGYGAVQSKKR
jgi:hypothetical protein